MFIKITGIIISMFILTNEVNAKSKVINTKTDGIYPTLDTEFGSKKPDNSPPTLDDLGTATDWHRSYIDLSAAPYLGGTHAYDITVVPSDPNSGFVKRPYE